LPCRGWFDDIEESKRDESEYNRQQVMHAFDRQEQIGQADAGHLIQHKHLRVFPVVISNGPPPQRDGKYAGEQ
jgi:hypothetical protein